MWKFLHLSIHILHFDTYTILYIRRNFRHWPQFGQSSFIIHGSFKCLPAHSSFHNHSFQPHSFHLIIQNCRGVSHTPFMAAKLHVRGWRFVGCYHFVFAHVRAYAIRPYICSIEHLGFVGWIHNIKSTGLSIALSMEFYKICRGVSHTPFIAAKMHVRR